MASRTRHEGAVKIAANDVCVCVCVYVPEDKLEMEGKVIALEEKRLC